MEKAIEFIKKSINVNPSIEEITVYGWQKEFKHTLIESISKYLFEDLDITENIAPITNENREGIVKPKYYITVHDTGDADPLHTAKFWSDTVKNEEWEQGKYACSYQYVVGNDGIYHNIPDNEIAWHAGDTTKYDYKLYDTGIRGENQYPAITISDDGYYEIDGVKSNVLAPRIHKEKDGVIIVDRFATKDDINDQSILCKLINGKYYIGETYFNVGYMLIANRGGNNNSIGIESCINEGTDIYYTWQKTAKLVAHLLYDNNLTFDDVKQHHYYSGKDCPQTIRKSNKWNHFMELVKTEYEAITLIKEGYKFTLITSTNAIKTTGRINNPSISNELITIQIEKNDKMEIVNFKINLNK